MFTHKRVRCCAWELPYIMVLSVPILPVGRSLEHSTILCEDPQQLPLLRLSWNKQDQNYPATFAMEKSEMCVQSCKQSNSITHVLFCIIAVVHYGQIFSWLYQALCTHHTHTAP